VGPGALGGGGNPSTDSGGGPSTGGGGEETGGSSSSDGEVRCDSTLTAPATGVCGVVTSGTSGVLLRGTVLGADASYRDGGVLFDDAGVIQCVGCDCEPGDATVVDCPEGVISPGLINPHDHITFANNAPSDWGTTRYAHRHEWLSGANSMPELDYSSGASAAVISFAELRFIMSGATSAASSGGRPGLLRNLDGNYLEGLPALAVEVDSFPLNDSGGTLRTGSCDYGAAGTTEADIAELDAYLPHIAEGIGDAAQNEFVCTSSSSVTGAHDLVEPQTAVVQALALTAADVALLRAEQASVVWSPRSNLALYGDTARVSLIDALGVRIALGTDWMPTGSMNLLRELRCADDFNASYLDGHFSDRELWRMVTENAAVATGTEDVIGILKVGYVADIAVFDARTRSDYRAVIGAGAPDVVLLLRGGEVLYGDAALLDEPELDGAGCEALDVCGVAKKACVEQDLGGGATLASLRAAGDAIYPLYFCEDETPTAEPSCVPYRSSYSAGISANDADGDGVADVSDACPAVFDPIRPMDGDVQAEFDGDGLGDACDPCPLADGTCTEPSADDLDGDGVLNGADVCPALADDQTDSDEDGKGDACDDCPDEANPGSTACTLSIATVRNPAAPGHPEVGSSVTVTGYVTAVRTDSGSARGFVLQASTEPWSGILVFTGSTSPGVAVGNEVKVSGVYDEYFDFSELISPVITILDAGTTLPFAPLAISASGTLSEAGTAEPYESMLVTLAACTISSQNPDDPTDLDEFSVNTPSSDPVRINDAMFAPLDNLCAVGSTFSTVTGTLAYGFGSYKLEPRSAADIVGASCQPYP
jgi:cytosine/adenosine deaminase-related metal-dependent hydrolase